MNGSEKWYRNKQRSDESYRTQKKQYYADSIAGLKSGKISPSDIGLDGFTAEQAIRICEKQMEDLD